MRKFPRYLTTYLSYVRKQSTVSYLPSFLGVETSGICNLRCIMCPHGQPLRTQRGLMSFDVFERVLDESKEFALDMDLFGGGEPLLHPRIYEMIRLAHNGGITTRIHTNATKLTDEAATELLESGLDFLSFSFDGYDEGSYERQRVNASYDVTVGNIVGFLERKRELRSSKPYTVVQILESRDAEGQWQSRDHGTLAVIFAGLPVDEFKIIPQHNFGGKVHGEGIPTKRYTPCTFPWYSLYVLWDGTIVPCCFDWWGDYSLGNLASTSLREAWHSPKLASLRSSLTTGDLSQTPLCARCDRLWQEIAFLGIPRRSARALRSFLR